MLAVATSAAREREFVRRGMNGVSGGGGGGGGSISQSRHD